MKNSTADLVSTNCDVIPMHGCNNVLALDVTSPHARARASSRQFQTAECSCQLLFPILRSVARAVQTTVSQQPAHVFISWLVVLKR